MSTAPVIDFDSMTTEQLRDLAIQAPESSTIDPEVPPTPAVTPAAPAPVTPTIEEDEAPEMYVREIDLGDGSGVQVFKAETLEELCDKLATAQEHATRKIRDLSKAVQTPAPVVPEVNTQDELELAHSILSEPSTVVRKILEKELGMTAKEARAKLDAADKALAEKTANDAAIEFVSTTPEYYACPENQTRMTRYLETYKMPPTVDSIKQAFNDLSASGLLAKKPGPKAGEPRIEDTPTPTTTRRAASSITTRRSAPAPVVTGPTEADFEKMSTEQLRELAEQSVNRR